MLRSIYGKLCSNITGISVHSCNFARIKLYPWNSTGFIRHRPIEPFTPQTHKSAHNTDFFWRWFYPGILRVAAVFWGLWFDGPGCEATVVFLQLAAPTQPPQKPMRHCPAACSWRAASPDCMTAKRHGGIQLFEAIRLFHFFYFC